MSNTSHGYNSSTQIEYTKSQREFRLRFGENNINAGRLRELPNISIDHFVGDDLKSTIFILTHVHTDHMVGLEFPEFLERLNSPDVKLYTSSVTPMLLPMFERYLGGKRGICELLKSNKIIPLDVNKEYCLQYFTSNEKYMDVRLTLLPAGHCPGSVMLLFEFDERRILYTGDCRISVEDLKAMPALHRNPNKNVDSKRLVLKTNFDNSNIKSIDHLYIDSTFCSVDRNFPFRGHAVQEAISHIKLWLLGSNNFVIRMSFSARVAHEYVLIQLYEILNLKTHVSLEKFEAYKHIPGISDCVTKDPNARIHLCEPKEECLKNKSSMTIRLSSMWYTLTPNIPDKIFARKGNTITLCYAMHSSLPEVGQMIDYLKPVIVTPLVLPRGCQRNELEIGLQSASSHTYIYKDYVHEPKVGYENESQTLEPEKQLEDIVIIDSQESVTYISDNDQQELSPGEGPSDSKKAKRISWSQSFSPSPEKKGSQSPY